MLAFRNHSDLLATFDDLVAKDVITYRPNQQKVLDDQGFTYVFHICSSLTSKPQAGDGVASVKDGHGVAAQPACFGPGSDIARGHEDMLIGVVNDTHFLVFNKFPVFRPQLLLLTTDSYRRQDEPLSPEDLICACAVLQELGDDYYMMYNCTSSAGASRKHKHMQIIPKPHQLARERKTFCLFPDDEQSVSPENVPFVYFIQRFQDLPLVSDKTGHQTLVDAYSKLLEQTREVLTVPRATSPVPHNVVLTKDWILAIPRRSNDFHHVTANGAGMMGSVWLMNEKQFEDWNYWGPSTVLAALGIARHEEKRP